MPRTAPGPRGELLLGSLPAARKDPIKLFLTSAQQYGDVVRLRFGPRIAHLLVDPDHIRHVFQDAADNYGKQTPGFQKIRTVLGQGLLTSEGEFWRRQRRIAQPMFHHKRIAGFAAVMARCAQDLAADWLSPERVGTTLDVLSEMMHLTLRIVSITLLSNDTVAAADEVGLAMNHILAIANDRMTRIIDVPARIPTRENRAFQRDLAVLDRVVLGMIAERRRTGEHKEDLLSMLMGARDAETGASMTDQQLRDEVMTIFLAGHETTANALTWTMLLLSKNPAEERLVRAELQAALGGRAPAFEDLVKLPRTKAIVEESMRLYPPAWMLARSVGKADELGGFKIPAGSLIFASPYVSHRSPARFENPEGFDPQRFLDGKVEKLARFSYWPFGGGPRICIGNAFALIELQLVLATLLQRTRLELVPGHDCTPEPSITLRPRFGMKMVVKPT